MIEAAKGIIGAIGFALLLTVLLGLAIYAVFAGLSIFGSLFG